LGSTIRPGRLWASRVFPVKLTSNAAGKAKCANLSGLEVPANMILVFSLWIGRHEFSAANECILCKRHGKKRQNSACGRQALGVRDLHHFPPLLAKTRGGGQRPLIWRGKRAINVFCRNFHESAGKIVPRLFDSGCISPVGRFKPSSYVRRLRRRLTLEVLLPARNSRGRKAV